MTEFGRVALGRRANSHLLKALWSLEAMLEGLDEEGATFQILDAARVKVMLAQSSVEGEVELMEKWGDE